MSRLLSPRSALAVALVAAVLACSYAPVDARRLSSSKKPAPRIAAIALVHANCCCAHQLPKHQAGEVWCW